MEFTPKTLIVEVMDRHPESRAVFERHQIEATRIGHRSLGEICSQKKLGFKSLRQELQSATAETDDAHDWSAASMTDILDHVERQYHARLEGDLPRVARLIKTAVEAHGARCPQLIEVDRVFGLLRRALSEHSRKEDRIVFPLIRWLEADEGRRTPPVTTLSEMMQALTHEHNTILATLLQLQRTTTCYTAPPDTPDGVRAMYRELAEFEGNLHAHMRIEDLVLFPRALQLEQRLSDRAQDGRLARGDRSRRRSSRRT